jgi:hypothetical protein
MFVSYFDTKLVMFVSYFDTFALILFLNRMITMARLESSIKVREQTKKDLKMFMERDFPEYPKFTYNESVELLLDYFDELQARLAEYE